MIYNYKYQHKYITVAFYSEGNYIVLYFKRNNITKYDFNKDFTKYIKLVDAVKTL